jgi:hypothetical protein
MFSEAQDLDPDHRVIRTAKGFAACYVEGVPKPEGYEPYYYQDKKKGPILWHPGFAWAARRDAFDHFDSGLVDFAILGAADNHMAHALVGCVKESVHPKVNPGYKRKLEKWEREVEKHLRRKIGYVDGLILHYWHGKKVDRKYWDRWKILVDNKFNPDIDLKYDWQGIHQLVDHGTPRSIQLRDDIMRYFRQRNEDSIDVE